MKFNIHAGHNADGRAACGAIGLIKESTEARKVVNEVIWQLRTLGHTVYDCTVNDATNQSANLKGIVTKCNQHAVDIDVSIHFNSGANNKIGDGKSTGTEVLICSATSKSKTVAENICKNISALGFKNRGVKIRSDLYVLKNTKSPALLVECCFVDDADDVKLYNAEKMASAIVKGLVGEVATSSQPVVQSQPTNNDFKVKINTAILNVRAGAGANNKINTTIKQNEVYTIVQTSNGWGKLKSGAGWINLAYTIKL